MEAKNNLSDVKLGGVSVNEIKDAAEGYYDQIQDRLAEVDKQVRATVNARPLACIAGAFAVGFVVARTLRAWRRS